ncbi:hypothetical protein COO09_03485 [Rhizorhabdus dicambivorans]|uniref:Uncharacterized protein n=1 Tax=Rhizorhabdus dicambivorans TaxID=1850238 RepID=A0A2A4G1V9_9SPHN|nr:hypothetical protein CMV14_20665 [Rhizorhabdus dicambivorans]PCE43993.1 hypothetical protein COO09_03485 [Rhizorhabdus dicambivorans]
MPTDNDIQFADLPKNRDGPTARRRSHTFDRAGWSHDIEHRVTTSTRDLFEDPFAANRPWTGIGASILSD